MLVDHFPRTFFLVVVVLTLEVQNPIDVRLSRDVFSLAFSDIANKVALELIPVGKFEGSLSPHEIFLELTSIYCVVCKLVYSSTLFKTIFEVALVDIAVGADLLAFSLGDSSHDFPRVDPAVCKLEVVDFPDSH